MNKVILIGNIVRDIVVRYTQENTAIMNNCIAVTERRTGKNGEKQEHTDFIEFTMFGKTAEIAQQYLNKGRKILIEGKLRIEQYQTQDGQNRTATKVIVENMEMLDFKKEENNTQQNYNQPNKDYNQNSGYNAGQRQVQPNYGGRGAYGLPPQQQNQNTQYEENNGTIPF